MQIRTTTISIVLGTFLVLMLSTNLVSRHIFSKSFDLLEEKAVKQNLERALNALQAEQSMLQTLVTDWGYWNDSYEFVKNLDQHYIQSNLIDDTFEELELNLIAFFDTKGQPVWVKTYDLISNTATDNTENFKNTLNSRSSLANKIKILDKAFDFTQTNGRLMMIAANAIRDSEAAKPSRGTLVMGKYISSGLRDRLAQRTKLELDIIPANSPSTPEWITAANKNSSDVAQKKTRRTDETITGHAYIFDLSGNKALSILVSMERDINSLSKSSLRHQLWATLIIGIILCTTMFILLEFRVISRISSLTKQVGRISRSPDPKAKIDLSGRDDISNLSSQINEMLAKLREKEHFLSGLLESLQAGVVVVDLQTHQVVEANPFALESFQRSREEVIGHVCHGFICPNTKCPIVPGETPEDLSIRKALRADGSEFSIFKSAKLIT